MKRVICHLFAILAITSLGVGIARAQTTFTTGQNLAHSLSVCIKKQDAIDIANAAKGGREQAEAVWVAKEECQNVTVVRGSVGKVAYAVKIPEGVMSVVEIVMDGRVIGWFLTASPVNKPQRNT